MKCIKRFKEYNSSDYSFDDIIMYIMNGKIKCGEKTKKIKINYKKKIKEVLDQMIVENSDNNYKYFDGTDIDFNLIKNKKKSKKNKRTIKDFDEDVNNDLDEIEDDDGSYIELFTD